MFSPRLTSKLHKDFVHGLDWHPTEGHLLSCGWDGQLIRHTLEGGGGQSGGADEQLEKDDVQNELPTESVGEMEVEAEPSTDNGKPVV